MEFELAHVERRELLCLFYKIECLRAHSLDGAIFSLSVHDPPFACLRIIDFTFYLTPFVDSTAYFIYSFCFIFSYFYNSTHSYFYSNFLVGASTSL